MAYSLVDGRDPFANIALGQTRFARQKRIECTARGLVALVMEGNVKGTGQHRQHACDAVKKALIEAALKEHAGNKKRAAAMLGISRNTLHTDMLRIGMLVQ